MSYFLIGLDREPQAAHTRIALLTIFSTSLVLFTMYSASLTSFLAVKHLSMPFEDLAGLYSHPNFKLGAPHGVAYVEALKQARFSDT